MITPALWGSIWMIGLFSLVAIGYFAAEYRDPETVAERDNMMGVAMVAYMVGTLITFFFPFA